MSSDTEHHTIRLLQEIRSDFSGRFDRIDQRFDQTDESVADLTARIDGNTLLLNLVASMLRDHEQRLTVLEKNSS